MSSANRLGLRVVGIVLAVVALMVVPASAVESLPDAGAAPGVPAGVDLPVPGSGFSLGVPMETLFAPLPAAADVTDFVVSPDSQWVVYRADATATDDEFHLYSMPIGGGTPVLLSADDPLQGSVEDDFAVSADSTRVVFRQWGRVSEEDPDFLLLSVPIGGGTRQLLNEGSPTYDFVISPDSSRVIYRNNDPVDFFRDLWSTPIGGGAAVRLNKNTSHGVESDYAVSADSSRVVFRQDFTSSPVAFTQTELVSVPIAGGTGAFVSTFAPDRDVVAFLLSPDSARAVFLGDFDSDNKWELYSAPIGGGSPPVKVNGTIAGIVDAFTISPDSSRVVYRSDGNIFFEYQLYSTPIAGPTVSDPVWLVNGLLPLGGDVQTDFRISPDSQTVVYRADQDVNDETELWSNSIVPAIGFLEQLNGELATGGDVFAFEISSNSERVAYIADERADTYDELFSVRLDGSDRQLLHAMSLPPILGTRIDVESLLVTPDSGRVIHRVLTRESPISLAFHYELFTVPIAGTASPQKLNGSLPVGGNVESDFQVSNDSTRAVYRADEDTNDKTEIYSVPTGVAPGDFDGDGEPDLVWRNFSTGENLIWIMNGVVFESTVSLGSLPAGWLLPATADFDGNGVPDLVLRNPTSGENTIWTLNPGGSFMANNPLGPLVGTEWVIGAADDFTGDGKPDLVWRNQNTGQNVLWEMNGVTFSQVIPMSQVTDTNWVIEGSADFTKDGDADIVWRNTSTNQTLLWVMNGALFGSSVNWGPVGPEWEFGGTGDYNTDATIDIVWRNQNTGQNLAWLMNPANTTQFLSIFVFSTVTDLNWHIVGP